MKQILILLTFLTMTGCATLTTVTWHDGKVITIKSKHDAMVTVKQPDGEVTVDNRGKPNIFESILGYTLEKTTLSNK